MSVSKANIVVVGSCMVDFVSYAPRLPVEGETIHGTKFATNFGGKGANQCVAAAKLGGKTAMVARVGDDIWGGKYIDNLSEHKVLVNHVVITKNEPSGIAQITVADSGNNQIVIVAGANLKLTARDVEKAREVVENASVVICQLETPIEVAIKAMEICKGISILNGAPAIAHFNPNLLTLPSIFCVNESEASVFTGLPVTTIEEGRIAISHLLNQGCRSVILTLGAQGSLYYDPASKTKKSIEYVPCPKVTCVDSTGAGDMFIGALAYLIANHGDLSLGKHVEIASKVASDSVTRQGTQGSYPSGKESIEKYL